LRTAICPLAPKSDFFRPLGFAGKVTDTIRLLIGDPIVWQLDQIFLKPGRHGKGTAWRQDNAYFRIKDRRQGVGIWTAIFGLRHLQFRRKSCKKSSFPKE
jgi:hypothetical protein